VALLLVTAPDILVGVFLCVLVGLLVDLADVAPAEVAAHVGSTEETPPWWWPPPSIRIKPAPRCHLIYPWLEGYPACCQQSPTSPTSRGRSSGGWLARGSSAAEQLAEQARLLVHLGRLLHEEIGILRPVVYTIPVRIREALAPMPGRLD
jgi:hypothetical protein